MPEKDPTNLGWVIYLCVMLLSGLGGLGGFVAFWQKLKDGSVRVFNVVEFIGELCTSAFTGILTYYLCEAAHFSAFLTAALVVISRHMGNRALF
jgi:hypothetical protein